MHPFRQYIGQYTSLPQGEWENIQAAIHPCTVSRDAHLLEEGHVCRKLYFVEEGLLRFYVWNEGEDKTKFFTVPPYLCTSQYSFTQQVPARENIQALEDCRLWVMDRSDAYRLLALPGWNTFVRCLVQQVQHYTENLYLELQQQTAEERYRRLLTQQGSLLNRIPLKYLSSYLGIAQPSLSRIRKKLAARPPV